MTKLATTNSYIVRICRIDTMDVHQLAGQVEALDGSGDRFPFTDLEQLAELLNRGAGTRKPPRKKRCT